MKIRELMSAPVHTCAPHETLAQAAQRMWEHDCGALPVVDHDGRIHAMLTDRDVCMAAWSRGLPPHALRVGDAMSKALIACRGDDDVATAAALLAQHQVHRLPVLDAQGALIGVFSVNDLVRHGDHDTSLGRQAVRTLAAVGHPRDERVVKDGALTPLVIQAAAKPAATPPAATQRT